MEQSHAGKGVCAHETLEKFHRKLITLVLYRNTALSQGRANLLFEEIKKSAVDFPASAGECW